MTGQRGPNSIALLRQLHARGLKITGNDEHAALVRGLVQLAAELDKSQKITAAMYGTYFAALRQLDVATATKEVEDDSPAEALRKLRSV